MQKKKNKTKNEKLFQNKERKGKRAQGKTLSVHLRKKKLLTLMLHILPTPLTHTRTHTDTNSDTHVHASRIDFYWVHTVMDHPIFKITRLYRQQDFDVFAGTSIISPKMVHQYVNMLLNV